MRRPQLVVVLATLLSSPAVFAQTSEEVREEQMFGEPEVTPDTVAAPDVDKTTETAQESSEAPVDAEATPQTDAESAREDDMFGEPEDTVTSVVAEAPASRDEATLSSQTSSSDIYQKLMEAEDPLAIGGQVFLRSNYSIVDEGDPEDFSLSMPNLVDLYLDARPGDRVRFFTRGRLSYDPTVDESAVSAFGTTQDQTTVKLDQLWLKFDVERFAYVTVGKQRIKWGTGRFWNPTDFLNSETLDPLSVSVFDERLGVSLLKVHVPVESLAANFYAIATLDDAKSPSDVGGALRGEFVIGTSEITTSVAVRKNNPLRLGADFNGAVGPIDLKVEAVLKHGVKTPFYRGAYNTSPLGIDEFDLNGVAVADIPAAIEAQLPGVLAARQPESYSLEDDWIPQVVAGVEYSVNYTEDDAIYIGAEYFFNDAGYDNADLYPVLIQSGAFTPFYTGRHYAGAYASLPAPGNWDDTSFTVSGFGNLSDRSFISRLDYSYKFATYLTFNAYAQGHFGAQGEFNYGYSQGPLIDPALVQMIPEDQRASLPAAVTDGVKVVGPLMDVGVGLRTSF